MRSPVFASAVLVLLTAIPVLGQDYQPTPAPRTPAIDRTWYRDADPLFFAGDLYYPAGPTVYFNGDTMVPTGAYDGITLYADTTIEPYTVILVPARDSLMRPYERVLEGHLPPRTANRSFYPSEQESEAPEAEEAQMRERGYRAQPTEPPAEPAVAGPAFEPFLIETARKPIDNLGIWVSFNRYRWTQAGDAVPLDTATMTSVGTYYGVPVYADARTPYVIYIPTRANLVAPFRRAQ